MQEQDRFLKEIWQSIETKATHRVSPIRITVTRLQASSSWSMALSELGSGIPSSLQARKQPVKKGNVVNILGDLSPWEKPPPPCLTSRVGPTIRQSEMAAVGRSCKTEQSVPYSLGLPYVWKFPGFGCQKQCLGRNCSKCRFWWISLKITQKMSLSNFAPQKLQYSLPCVP